MKMFGSCWLLGLMLGLSGCSGPADAQFPPSTLAHPIPTTATAAAPRNAADDALRAALLAAESGRAVDQAAIAAHPLAAWVEFAALKYAIDTVPPEQGHDFLLLHRGQAVAAVFRPPWLQSLARREDWQQFRKDWSDDITSPDLRCVALHARAATAPIDAAWIHDAQTLWRSSGKSLPASCDPVFVLLDQQGGLTDALRWQRIDLAIDELQPGVIRSIARGLPAGDAALANDYAAFLDAVHERALQWPKTVRSRAVVSRGLARLARSTPIAAETALPKYVQALHLDDAERGRVLYQIALQSAASYEPEAAQRLAAVPANVHDETLHELRVREAIVRSDWKAALTAIDAMGAEQSKDTRWIYLQGRLHALLGDAKRAQALYRTAAKDTNFHGFLAADQLQAAYALCDWNPNDAPVSIAAVARDPALVRALSLYRIDRVDWAKREWNDALTHFDAMQRRIAVGLAQADGWHDRGVFGLINVDGKRYPDEQRLYALRFPLPHAASIRREAARHALDPAWVAAEIRAESLFDTRARSPANAMGLMQLLPDTGKDTAQRIGVDWGGAESLYDPDVNIALGSAYLRQLLDRFGGKTHHAIAGYNAGPNAAARWVSERPMLDADLWIETIPYKETREYVARVLSFTTLYDWRMTGKAQRVSDRMAGHRDAAHVSFKCMDAP